MSRSMPALAVKAPKRLTMPLIWMSGVSPRAGESVIWLSGDQDGGAGGGASGERFMRLHDVFKFVARVDRDGDVAARNRLHQVLGGSLVILALGDVVEQRRPCREERSLLLQQADVESLDLPRRRTVGHESAERADAIERAREGRLADAVIDDVAERALGDLLHALDEILLIVEDDVLGAGLPGEFRLGLRARRADHGRAERLAPLAQQQADAASRRMNEDRVALLHLERAAQEILRGQSLQ